jgi:ankyrin repeat protein
MWARNTLEALPEELQGYIAEFLTIQDYHRLRISSKYLKLPLIPYLTFKTYKESKIHYESPDECCMKFHMSFLDLERFLYLAKENHVSEFRRCLGSPESRDLAPQFKQEAFRIAVMPTFKKDIILELVKDGEVDPSCYNDAAIRYACKMGFDDLVELLIKDPRVESTLSDCAPLRLAIVNGHFRVTQLLVKHPLVSPSGSRNESICLASGLGHVEIFTLLLEHGVDITTRDNQAMKNACTKGHVQILKLILADPRVDPSFSNNVALLLACKGGHVPIVQLLLQDDRIDPSLNRNEALLNAVACNQWQVVKVLIEDGRIDPLLDNCKCIQITAAMGNVDLLIFLLQLDPIQSFVQAFGVPKEWIPDVPIRKELETSHSHCVQILTMFPKKCEQITVIE